VIVNNFRNIDNACVLYHSGRKEICLFYESDSEIPMADFRKEFLKYLPKYMAPSQLFFFKELPRNPNGKIDRNALKETLSS
jgi:acyl-coenzyme A synthetase/AMP-(fatty) acid ligase